MASNSYSATKANSVYVSNIPNSCSRDDIKDLFTKEIGEVSHVEFFYQENNEPKGCGIVQFKNSALVDKCVSIMHKYDQNGHKFNVCKDFGSIRDRHGNLILNNSVHNEEFWCSENTSTTFGRNNKWGNTYGLNHRFLESLRINSRLCNSVFVRNLDYRVDKKKIKEVFRLAGKVQHVNLPYNKDGKIRGFAIIEYDHPVEAVQAISMFHNQQLFDCTMVVRMNISKDIIKLPEGLHSLGTGLGTKGEPLKDVARNFPAMNSGQETVAQNPLDPFRSLFALYNIHLLEQVVTSQNVLRSFQPSTNLSSFKHNHGSDMPSVGLSPTSKNIPKLLSHNYNSSNDNNSFKNNISVSCGSVAKKETPDKGSNKISISNLPAMLNFTLLRKKLTEYGKVLTIERDGENSALVIYSSNEGAQTAFKMMDKARINGRTIKIVFV